MLSAGASTMVLPGEYCDAESCNKASLVPCPGCFGKQYCSIEHARGDWASTHSVECPCLVTSKVEDIHAAAAALFREKWLGLEVLLAGSFAQRE